MAEDDQPPRADTETGTDAHRARQTTNEWLIGYLSEYFDRIDVPTFCWLPRRLMTYEVAFWRTVYGRRCRRTGFWEYYNYPQFGGK